MIATKIEVPETLAPVTATPFARGEIHRRLPPPRRVWPKSEPNLAAGVARTDADFVPTLYPSELVPHDLRVVEYALAEPI